MKTKTFFTIAIAFLAFTFSACSFSTANISSLNFGKNQTATPPATTFEAGEKVFAVADVANAMGKYKMKFNVLYENVAGKTKNESVITKDIDFEGSAPIYLSLSLPLPGEYKIESILNDEDGKELGRKSGNITVKGSAPAATKTNDEQNSDEKADKE